MLWPCPVLEDDDHIFLRLIEAIGTDLELSNVDELSARNHSTIDPDVLNNITTHIQTCRESTQSSPT